MKNENEQLEALQDIRKMMKESSRFLSLSGLSGILAGIYALAGAVAGRQLIKNFNSQYPRGTSGFTHDYQVLEFQILAICSLILILSVTTAFYMSGKKARKNGHKLLDHSSRKLLWSMAIPLLTGGIFCFALIMHGGDYILLVSPAMLIFYGLALVSSSRLTLNDVKYLGYMEILLGLLSCFYQGHGIMFWSLGFGVLHIIYGSIMWFKYDRV